MPLVPRDHLEKILDGAKQERLEDHGAGAILSMSAAQMLAIFQRSGKKQYVSCRRHRQGFGTVFLEGFS